MNIIQRILFGFIAGAIATVTIHEIISSAFANGGFWTGWDRMSWDMELNEYGVPKIASAAFWGGLWGSLFGLILGDRPEGMMTIRGAILGVFLPALVGVFLLVPIIKGGAPFFGGDVSKIVPVLVILAGYGAVTAWLYGLFRYGRLP